MMNLRQIHLKAVTGAVPGVKEVAGTPLSAPSLVACSYPSSLLESCQPLDRYHHQSLSPRGSLLNKCSIFRGLAEPT